MLRPDELRLMAMQWRNIVGAVENQTEYMRSCGLAGCTVIMGDFAKQHALSIAEQLEERADEIEKTRGPL
jgi:hypothetical protein